MAKTPIERQLKELDQIRKKGVLSDEEYATRREAILVSTAEPDHKKRGGPLKWGFLGCLGIMGAIGAVVVAVVILIAVASGGSSSGGGDDVHAAFATGSSGVISPEGSGDKKTKVTILDIKDPATSDNEFQQPADGKKYIAIDVEVENVGEHETSWLSWKLRDSKDQEHDDTLVTGMGDSLDAMYNLTPGGKTQGWVVFEVDEDASVKWVRADPSIFTAGDLYFDASTE